MQDDTQVTAQQQAPTEDAQPQVDTAAEQNNLADVQVTSEAPEATQGEGDKSQEVKATDTASEERLYAGKYKSVEEMEKAYAELNSKATRDAQEKAELARILNESFTSPEPDAQQQPVQGYDEYDTPDPVAQEIEKLKQQQVASTFIFTHPDADPKGLEEVFKTDPLVNSITDYNARLEYAYQKSKNIASQKAIEEARKQGATENQVKTLEKQAAQVESAAQQAQPDTSNEELSQDQLRAVLKNDDSFDAYIKKRMKHLL